jgi:16S rRNA C1402 N4-methylase RsmH
VTDRFDDYQLHQEAQRIAGEIKREREINPTANRYDLAREFAQNHRWAIYTYQALRVCTENNTDDAEYALGEAGLYPKTLGSMAVAIAEELLYQAVCKYITVEKMEED